MTQSKTIFVNLSRIISHALRHEPWLYELELDEEGWVSVEELIFSLRGSSQQWHSIVEHDLFQMIEQSEKKRHEILNGKIRALYGHSIPGKLAKHPSMPPEYLYHGTAPEFIEDIKMHGLLPMKRQYVHLSVDVQTAKQVGQRKSLKPVILIIHAKEAYENGIHFYRGNDLVWLVDLIPISYIKFG